MTQAAVAAARLHVVVKRSIEEIPEAEWDNVGAAHGLFWTHRFFRTVEQANIENARSYYVLAYAGDRLVGSAVLSSFVVSLDLLMPRLVQRICAAMRTLWPGFMRIRALFCGVPVSIGKHALASVDDVHPREIIPHVVACMEEIAQSEGIRYLCFKEFAESELADYQSISSYGFFRARSIPRIHLPIRWTSYEAYLSDMRSSYRRQILGSMKRFRETSRGKDEKGQEITSPHLVIDSGRFCPPEVMYQLYMQVMEHTVVKLEVLNRQFFHTLYAHLQDDVKLLVVEKDATPLAAALLSNYRGTLTFLFVGLDYAHRDEHCIYLNLLNFIVQYAIEQRCSLVDLGQTSYWLKQRLGGEAEPMYFFLRAESRPLHRMLELLGGLLFPPTRLPNPRVFHS